MCYRSFTSTMATFNSNNNILQKKYLHKNSNPHTHTHTHTHIYLFIYSPAYLDTVTFTDNYAKQHRPENVLKARSFVRVWIVISDCVNRCICECPDGAVVVIL